MNKQSFSILSLLLEKGNLSIHDMSVISNIPISELGVIIGYLRTLGYVEILPGYLSYHNIASDTYPTPTTPLRITQSGISFYEQETSQSKKQRISEIRSWITLIVSFTAMIASIISVILELCQ